MLNWGEVINDYSWKLNNFWGVALFFGSFVMVSIFLYALMNGLVWEVFNKSNPFNIFNKSS
jgi:hypothetical protein